MPTDSGGGGWGRVASPLRGDGWGDTGCQQRTQTQFTLPAPRRPESAALSEPGPTPRHQPPRSSTVGARLPSTGTGEAVSNKQCAAPQRPENRGLGPPAR